MLQQISIGKRLLAGFGVVLAALLVVAAAGQLSLARCLDDTQRMIDLDVAAAEHALRLEIAVRDMRRFEKDVFINSGDPVRQAEYRGKWDMARVIADGELVRLDALVSDTERASIARTRRDIATYQEAFLQIGQAYADGELRDATAGNRAIASAKDPIHRVEGVSQRLENSAAERLREKRGAIEEMKRRAQWVILLVSLVSLTAGFAIALAITRSITRPMRVMTDVAERLADGDAEHRMVPNGRDETADLMRSLQRVVDARRSWRWPEPPAAKSL